MKDVKKNQLIFKIAALFLKIEDLATTTQFGGTLMLNTEAVQGFGTAVATVITTGLIVCKNARIFALNHKERTGVNYLNWLAHAKATIPCGTMTKRTITAHSLCTAVAWVIIIGLKLLRNAQHFV